MTYTTNPLARARFIASLRELADFLEAHEDIPVPKYGTEILLCANKREAGGKAQVDYVARLLSTTISDETGASGHYWASRKFADISYTILSIPGKLSQDQEPVSAMEAQAAQDQQLQYEADLAAADLAESGYGYDPDPECDDQGDMSEVHLTIADGEESS